MAQSELLTHDGYPAVQLENGSHMTEYSITVTDPRLNGGRPTNIPSLWERKIVDQNTAVEKALQSKKEYKSFDTIKEAVSDSERKSNAGGANAPKEYNRGGAVRNLLATGGMMQEGGTVDPVSGNDVPTGSLKEEVRDDIPAQLSPGEFVFPADVTRYIGLEKLMQIREAAKEGLKEMESKGQMGNAEEVEGDAVDEDKFSSHIDEIMAGLEGGEGAPKKYAVGGSVNTSDYSAAPIKGFKMVQYEDVKTKAVKYIPFVNGKALLPVPTGYVEKKVETAPTTPVAPAAPIVDEARAGGGGGGRGDRSQTDGDGEPVSGKPNDAGIEGFGDIQGGTNRNVGRVAGLAAGLINPFAGLLVSAASHYAIKKNNEKMAAANAAAIDASALAAAGFEAKDIKAAQDAAAKATLEGKSAKDVAVAAANAASLSAGTALGKSVDGNYGAKTSLDALVGITNGFNTANKDVMAMPQELADKVEPRTWSDVVKAIEEGLTPEQAVQRVAETAFAGTVGSYFSGTMTEKEAAARLDAAGLAGQVPAGQFNNVAGYMQAGFTAQEAIDKVTSDQAYADIAKQDAAEKAQAEQSAKDAAEREASREQADKANRDAADRAAEQSAKDAADRAEQSAKDAADKESSDINSGNTSAWDIGSLDAAESNSGNSSGNNTDNNGGYDNGE